MSILVQQESIYLGNELDKLYAEKALTRKQKFKRYLLNLYDSIILIGLLGK